MIKYKEITAVSITVFLPNGHIHEREAEAVVRWVLARPRVVANLHSTGKAIQRARRGRRRYCAALTLTGGLCRAKVYRLEDAPPEIGTGSLQ